MTWLQYALILIVLLHSATSKKYGAPLKRRRKVPRNIDEIALQIETLRSDLKYFEDRKGGNPHTQPFYQTAGESYISNVSVGTPPQEFRVILDTGSADFWIPTRDCQVGQNVENQACNKILFNSDNSSTFQNLGTTFQITYGTGFVVGTTASETVGLGRPNDDKLVVPKQTIGLAHQIDEQLNGFGFDGIVGLAFRALSKEGGQPVFLNAVDQGLVDEPIFTIWLTRDQKEQNDAEDGLITYGGHDEEHCDSDIHWIPLAHETWWIFEGQGVSINGQKTNTTFKAITDSGTWAIAGHPTIIQPILDALNAQYNETLQAYQVPCSSNFTVGFTINGKDYNVVSKNLLLPGSGDSCVLTVDTFEGIEVQLILGDPFIREYCQVHDVKEGRVGFALAKE